MPLEQTVSPSLENLAKKVAFSSAFICNLVQVQGFGKPQSVSSLPLGDGKNHPAGL